MLGFVSKVHKKINLVIKLSGNYQSENGNGNHQAEQGKVLFVAPHRAPFITLGHLIDQSLKEYNFTLEHPMIEDLGLLQEMIKQAELVIGVWDSAEGRAALFESSIQQRPLLALAKEEAQEGADWLSPFLYYFQEQENFVMALNQALLLRFDEQKQAQHKRQTNNRAGEQVIQPFVRENNYNSHSMVRSPKFGVSSNGKIRKSELLIEEITAPVSPLAKIIIDPPDVALLKEEQMNKKIQIAIEERRRIYERVALDKRIPITQRFHAARVLTQSGKASADAAARALGSILLEKNIGQLADDALELLGTLGKAAHPILWYLDARTIKPLPAIAIARQLGRAGDSQTALFRLEQLVQHGREEEIRLAAVDALAEMGEVALPELEKLAQKANDLNIRLKALRCLCEQHESPDTLLHILEPLALQGEEAELAQEAVRLISPGKSHAIDAALMNIAIRSASLEAQLAAAEELYQRGEGVAARAILLKLAESADGHAADAALDILVNVSDETTQDSERLMNNARLRSIRRRAAILLCQAHQPEGVQQAAARVFLALDRPKLARPVLTRLACNGQELDIRRWAAQQLALIGDANGKFSALDEIRQAFAKADDPVVGQHLAEGLLRYSKLADDRRQAALWLAEHANLPRAVQVLKDLALSLRISGSDAVQATNDIGNYAANWAGAARALGSLVNDSPHAAVRARALDLLLRDYPSELPLSLLVDLAITGSIGTIDRVPVMEQLTHLARPAVSRIADRMTAEETNTDQRWQLLNLINELPDTVATEAFMELSARAPQNRIRYVAAEQLIARNHKAAGYAALATIAINEADTNLREMALTELGLGYPETDGLLKTVIERTHYEDTFFLARDLLYYNQRTLIAIMNRRLDDLVMHWDEWVASLQLTWLDNLVKRVRGEEREVAQS